MVSSQAALERAEARITPAPQREWDAIEKPLFPLHAPRLETPEVAQAALTALAQVGRSHQRDTSRVIEPTRYAGKGRPTPTSPLKAIAWQMHAQGRPAQEVIEAHQHQRACCIMGTNIPACHVSAAEVLRAYQAPSGVEGGGRFLTAPVCVVSSRFVQTPSRIQG